MRGIDVLPVKVRKKHMQKVDLKKNDPKITTDAI